jgi:hemerythrin superfamily protein
MELAESGLRYRLRRVLRQIGAQHRQLREIRGEIAQALASGDANGAQDAVARYRHAVGAHFELEDAVFFPALHGLHPEAGNDLAALNRDHEHLLAALGRLAALLAAGALEEFRASFERFVRELAAHENSEECVAARLGETSRPL